MKTITNPSRICVTPKAFKGYRGFRLGKGKSKHDNEREKEFRRRYPL